MWTKTLVSAIRTLAYIGRHGTGQPISPRHMAEQLHESRSYLAKVVRQLVKAGFLIAHRGVAGGVTLNRPLHEITLLAVVEAIQGEIRHLPCEPNCQSQDVCAFRRAAMELQEATVAVLSRWRLADIVRQPESLEWQGIPCVLPDNHDSFEPESQQTCRTRNISFRKGT